MARCAYIFLDESGNFDFSASGFPLLRPDRSQHAATVSGDCERSTRTSMTFLKPDEISKYFHCAHDRRVVRNRVFDLIAAHLNDMRMDCLVTEKSTISANLRRDTHFYPRMLGLTCFERHILSKELTTDAKEIIVITDSIPLHNRRHVIAKAVKRALTKMLPQTKKLPHHAP